MENIGSFTYRRHQISYKIGKYLGGWRIKVHLVIDKGEPTTFIGIIPVRNHDIRKMAHYLLYEKHPKDNSNDSITEEKL